MPHAAHADDLPAAEIEAVSRPASIPPYARVRLKVSEAEGIVLPYEVYGLPVTSVPVTFFRSRVTLKVGCDDLAVIAYETDEQRKKREEALEEYERELNRSLRF